MTRRWFLAGLGFPALLLAAAGASAEAADDIVAELRAAGYSNIVVERTLLGRVRITGETDRHRREVVLDPTTGEILRDLTEEKRSALPGDAAVGRA